MWTFTALNRIGIRFRQIKCIEEIWAALVLQKCRFRAKVESIQNASNVPLHLYQQGMTNKKFVEADRW